MDIELNKEKVCINKMISKKKELIFVNNDMIVPDSKPDILNTLNVSGNVCIYKKEIKDGSVKIDGVINTYVMYIPDSNEDNLRALNFTMDFSENILVPGIKEGMILICTSELKDIECKVINGRKINLKAGIEFDFKVYSNEDIEFIDKVNNIEDIQTLEKDFNINSLIGYGKTTVYAKDTLNIDSQDELAEILKATLRLTDKDIKLSYNKVLTKAEAELNIIYLTEDNRIGNVIGKIPIVGFIDIQNISEDNNCDVSYEIKSLQIKPNAPEEHSIYIELEIEPTCIAYEKRKVNLIQDLYSPSKNLEYSQKRITTLSDKNEISQDFTIKDSVNISGIEDGKIINVEAVPIVSNTSITTSKINYTGDINLNIIYIKDNIINSRVVKIPWKIEIENKFEKDEVEVETEIVVANVECYIKQGDEIECKIEMRIITKTSINSTINIIDNIEILDQQKSNTNEDYDSLILYIVRPADTLWEIAKRFNTTVNEIARMNGIEDIDKIDIGQKIYIPKFNLIQRENSNNGTEAITM